MSGGAPRIVGADDEAIVPSCVGLDESGAIVVGPQARNQYAVAPERTVRSIKRLMGSDTRVRMGPEAYSPPGDIGVHPEGAQGAGGRRARTSGPQSGNHRARVLYRRAAAGDPGGGPGSPVWRWCGSSMNPLPPPSHTTAATTGNARFWYTTLVAERSTFRW